jgi:hypothetical protein
MYNHAWGQKGTLKAFHVLSVMCFSSSYSKIREATVGPVELAMEKCHLFGSNVRRGL